MCPCRVGCSKKIETELPENESWQLYRTAYEQYQSEILNGEKSYSRYVNDFIYYHLPCLSIREADIRLHVMHVFALKELLEERRDLVDAFFSKDVFEEKDFLLMDALFNKGKNLEEPEPVCLAHFSDGQISLITNFVRSTSLFKSEVTENSIRDLFECRLQVPLQATVNRYVLIRGRRLWKTTNWYHRLSTTNLYEQANCAADYRKQELLTFERSQTLTFLTMALAFMTVVTYL